MEFFKFLKRPFNNGAQESTGSDSNSLGKRLERLEANDKEPLGIGAFTQQENISLEDFKTKELLPLTSAEKKRLEGLRRDRGSILAVRVFDKKAGPEDARKLSEIEAEIGELEAREKVS